MEYISTFQRFPLPVSVMLHAPSSAATKEATANTHSSGDLGGADIFQASTCNLGLRYEV